VTLILASTSASRRAMLEGAGVAFEAVAPGVDEDAAKASLAHLSPRDLADALAELKAVKVSARRPGALVLGSDSVGDLDGVRLDKPGEGLADQLRLLSGKSHKLHSAAVVAQDGVPVWRAVETAKLTVRPLGDAFIADYVARDPDARWCAGGYRIEGFGAQLFDRVEGSWFAILGLPLLPLLGWLRMHGQLPS
jgi:septum formation protein